MPNLSTCHSPTCAVTVDGFVATCPKCGGPMRAIRENQIRAWVMIICGVILVVMMGAIALATAPMMLNPGTEVGDSTWNGTREQGQIVLTLFGMVFLLGCLALANGIYQLRTGRQSKLFIVLTLGTVGALALVVFAFFQMFKTPA